jgi:hypothetical protein
MGPAGAEHEEAGHDARQRHGQQAPADAGAAAAVDRGGPLVRPGGGQRGQDHAGQPAELQRSAVDVPTLHLEGEQGDVGDAHADQAQGEREQRAVDAHPEDGADGHEHGEEQHARGRAHHVDERDRLLAGVGVQVGAQDERHPGGQAAQGADDPVEPHAGVEPGHPRPDDPDHEDVEHQVAGQRHHVGQGGRRPVAVDAGGEHAQGVADRAQRQRDAETDPGDPLHPHPRRRREAGPGRGQIGQVEEDDVVGPVPRHAVGAVAHAGGEQQRQADRQEQCTDGSSLRDRRLSMLCHARGIGLRPRRPHRNPSPLT